jgi:hypothetical protein
VPLQVYGDISVDNYEYFGEFSSTYETILRDLPGGDIAPCMSPDAEHRVVACALGGSYLLARFASMALSLWRSKNPIQHPDDRDEWFKSLKELEPWAKEAAQLRDQNSNISKRPADYDGLLRLHYRLTRSPHDKCFRVEVGGEEGYTLPVVYQPDKYLNSKNLYQTNDRGSPAITVDKNESCTHHILLFNDGGLRYKSDPDSWLETEIDQLGADNVWAVIKSRDPIIKNQADHGSFVRFLTRLNKKISNKTVLCLNADDLRAFGVEIGRSLSWEKSIKDLELNIRNGKLLAKHLPAHLVVTFDYDAVVYLKLGRENDTPTVEKGTFIFSKNNSEGEFSAKFDGKMPGAQSLFVSVFSALLYEWWKEQTTVNADEVPFAKFIGYALLAKRRMLECGFVPIDADGIIRVEPGNDGCGKHFLIPRIYYQEAIFALQERRPENEDLTRTAPIAYRESEKERPSFRSPIDNAKEKSANDLSQLKKDLSQRDLVIFPFESPFFDGETEIFRYLATKFEEQEFINYVLKDDSNLPVCTMGKLRTISREEIDGLRTIRRLAQNYLEAKRPNEKPIGITVLGQPGAGKSFAVKTVFETLPKACKDLIEDAFLECNLAGLERPEDIAEFFQLARDKRLRGKVPVLFFDEFDCTVDDEPYFWLKHFLAPLQDGEFITGHTKRPIGKSIFVFAGGINENYRDLQRAIDPELPAKPEDPGAAAGKTLADEKKPVVKGRDFISRLQAHIDIMGLQPKESVSELTDEQKKERIKPYTMRKAILLRGLLDQWAPQIFDVLGSKKSARMDEDLVRQFLTVWQFKHGVRSMEAIIRMSSLTEAVRYSKSCLPPETQLFMHIDRDSYKSF